MKLLYFILVLLSVSSSSSARKPDYIVVGGGTAGCVVAARLSEDPDVSVLLLEAGPSDRNYPAIAIPAYQNRLGELDWGYFSEPQKNAGQGLPDKKAHLSIARVLGGCSSHNNQNVVRGNPEDYDRWRDLGNKGWGYDDVLPFFKKFEDMQVQELTVNGFHGVGGPVSITEVPKGKLLTTFLEGGLELGFNVTDHNSDRHIGFATNQISIKNGRRASMSEAYIWPNIGRFNLKVVLNAFVFKIKTKARKATGVYYKIKNKTYFVRAKREVIVCAGALNSPKLLMLSGIGPQSHLKRMKIPVVKDLPVGNELNDHIFISLGFFINEPISRRPKDFESFENLLSFILNGTGPFASPGTLGVAFKKASSQSESETFPFLQLLFIDDIYVRSPEQVDKFGFTIAALHLHHRTFGKVRLRDSNIFSAPKVNLAMLEDDRDMVDFIEGARFMQSLIETESFQSIGAEFAAPPLEVCSDFSFGTNEYWRCHLTYLSFSGLHYMGTCKMDPGVTGVVDDTLRVKGFKNLRVADASIMPNAVSGNTMAPTIMIGENAADIIRKKWKRKSY